MVSTIILFLVSMIIGAGSFIGYQTFQKADIPKAFTPSVSLTPTPTISFSVDRAPKDSLRADIIDMDGETFWESRTATEPAKLHQIQSIQQGEKLVTGEDGTLDLTVGKSVRISLDNETQLALTQTLPMSIVLTQTDGVATYTLDSRTQPVAIRIRRLLIRIIYGKVIVSAKPDGSDITVHVKQGSVEVGYNDAKFTSQRMIVTAGEIFTFDNDTRTGEIE